MATAQFLLVSPCEDQEALGKSESGELEPTLSFRRRSDVNVHVVWCVVR